MLDTCGPRRTSRQLIGSRVSVSAIAGSVARWQFVGGPRFGVLKIAKDGIRRSGDTREDRSMFTQRSGSVASYAAVAAATAILSAVGTWDATQFVARSAA